MKHQRVFLNSFRTGLAFLALLSLDAALATEVIAHRANGCGHVENSVAAVAALQNASKPGIKPGIELDVQISSDDILYLFHDDKIENQRIDSLTYAEIAAKAGLPAVPKLSVILSQSLQNQTIVLDLKQLSKEQIPLLNAVIVQSSIPATSLVIQSENLAILKAVRAAMPQVRTALLHRLKRRFPFFLKPDPASLARLVESENIDVISIKGRRFINAQFMQTLKAMSADVFVWTINETDRAQAYLSYGADAIITDNPFTLIKTLNGNQDELPDCFDQISTNKQAR